MRVLEAAIEDEGFSSLVQLPKLKALTFEKKAAKKAKAIAETKDEQLLKDNANLKELHQEVKVELRCGKALFCTSMPKRIQP